MSRGREIQDWLRLLPLLESSIEDKTPGRNDAKSQSSNEDNKSSEDNESLADSAEYDTDLDVDGQ